MRRGIREYDVQKAVEYAENTQKQFGNGELGYTPGSLSHTLEYAYTDWCLGQLMGSLGKRKKQLNMKNVPKLTGMCGVTACSGFVPA